MIQLGKRLEQFALVLFLAIGLLCAGAAQATAAGEEHRFLPAHSLTEPAEACGVAVDSAGDLYVSRPEEFLVQVFDSAAAPIVEFEAFANAAEPCGLAVDSGGAVYVADIEGMVVRYVPAGGEFPPTEASEYEVDEAAGQEGVIVEAGVKAVAIDPSDDHLYVAEGSHVSEYEADGTVVRDSIGAGVAGARYHGVGVHGASGRVYAVDANSDDVYVFNPAGTSIETTIDGSANPNLPAGFGNLENSTLAVDQASGNVFVNNERANFAVTELTAAGAFVSQIGPWLGTGKAKLGASPNGATVAVDNGSGSPNAGDVYVPGLYFELPSIYTGVYAFAGELAPIPPPAVANADPAAVTETGALLKGSFDNEGAQSGSSCRFVLALASAPATPVAEPACSPGFATDDASHAVQATVEGLSPGTGYVYRVVAANAGGSATATPAKAFSTAAPPPIVPNPDPALIARWEPCEPDTGVTVIVDRNERLGDGKVHVGCALGEQESGLAALHNAGFATVGVGGGDAFVCRIDGLPTPAEESCAQTPGADRYWSYWHGFPGGRWGYSGFGATSPVSRAPVNSVQGWGFGRAPRIEPIDGGGPSSFLLPPEQESSDVPAALAREWLTGVTATAAERALTPAGGVEVDTGDLLAKVTALGEAGAPASEMSAARQLLTSSSAWGSHEYTAVELWANSVGTGLEVDPADPSFPLYGSATRYAQAVLAAAALGDGPGDFAAIELRASLASMIDEASGKLRRKTIGGGEVLNEEPGALAAVVNALAATGPLPAKALKSVDLLVAQQETGGGFGLGAEGQALAIRALAAARGRGAAGLDAPIAKAGKLLAALQEADGSVRAAAGGGSGSEPTFTATAAGAVGLALAGLPAEAERAAKRVSRFQVVRAYVGQPDPSTGETAPAEPLIGAFLPTEADLRHALAHGLPEDGPHGPYDEAHVPTARALEAFEAAGPYGPVDEPEPPTEPQPPADPGPVPPQLPPPPPRPGADSIRAAKTSRVTGRLVRVASLACPAGGTCQVKLPARVRLKIARKAHRAVVLAPASLGPGETAAVRLRLSGRTLEALADAGRGVVRLRVELIAAGGTVSRVIQVRIAAQRPPPST